MNHNEHLAAFEKSLGSLGKLPKKTALIVALTAASLFAACSKDDIPPVKPDPVQTDTIPGMNMRNLDLIVPESGNPNHDKLRRQVMQAQQIIRNKETGSEIKRNNIGTPDTTYTYEAGNYTYKLSGKLENNTLKILHVLESGGDQITSSSVKAVSILREGGVTEQLNPEDFELSQYGNVYVFEKEVSEPSAIKAILSQVSLETPQGEKESATVKTVQ